MNTDIMIDLETLDTTPNATILTIGAIKFDPFGDDLHNKNCEKLYIKVDVDSCDYQLVRQLLLGGESKVKQHRTKRLVPRGEYTLEMLLINFINFVGAHKEFGAMVLPLI